MQNIVDEFVTWSTGILISCGPVAGFLLIILESIIPALPLGVFVTLNVKSYGMIAGFLISWLSTVAGCMLSFFIFRKLFQKKLYNFIKERDSEKLDKFMKTISTISFTNLVLLIALPFTPASWINVGAGLSKVKTKKYFAACLVGKPSMIYFWGYVGKSLLESLTDVTVVIKIVVLLLVAFVISKLIEKKFKLR